MQLIEFVGNYGGWSWIVAGLILLALELVVPGGFMVWMGISGLITGLVVLVQPIGAPAQWLLFGVLSLVSIALWVRVNRNRRKTSDRPNLNRRTEQMIGQEAVLIEPISDGYGRVAFGDSIWRVSGPNLPKGQKVRIIGAEGAVLRVEAAGY